MESSPAFSQLGSLDRADGLWLAAGIDPGTGERRGVTCPWYEGRVLAGEAGA